ncbi:thioredoxin-like protein [Venturia nashicola]|uniref:Thioredoxin-like protein n=1 Tax=Venturia nashicola TaxID=86259 RepID=A0A4Z1NVZ6_9PEZI|nr:thioredoxin-like protein [Venturia nashicola]TLD29799.1 thioredoxin-like protein [Venturia nashicola]
MASTAAQDEFNALFESSSAAARSHPEDVENQTPEHSDSEPSEEPPADQFYEKDDDDAQDNASNMRSAYYIPKLRSDANTGPKGVIADAQAFEQARKQARFSFSTKGRRSPSPPATVPRAYPNDDYEKSSEEEDDDGFMARWRQRRLQELTNKRFSRGPSPNSANKRVWGSLVRVDAEGYLDAIEKAPAHTVVVVFIYDPQSEISHMVEACVRDIAKSYTTTRFVQLNYEEAEMEVAGVPAVLAYRGGNKFAGLVPVVDEIPEDQELSAKSLAIVLKKWTSHPPSDFLSLTIAQTPSLMNYLLITILMTQIRL